MSKGWPSGLYFHWFYLASRRPWPWTAGIVAWVSLWAGESARAGASGLNGNGPRGTVDGVAGLHGKSPRTRSRDGPGGRPAKGAHATLILAKGNRSVGQMALVCLYTHPQRGPIRLWCVEKPSLSWRWPREGWTSDGIRRLRSRGGGSRISSSPTKRVEGDKKAAHFVWQGERCADHLHSKSCPPGRFSGK